MIVFVVAMNKEAQLFLNEADIIKRENIADKCIYIGKFLKQEFALIVTGIGKVNAALGTQLMIDKFNPQLIINFGVAGGKANSDLNAGDVALIDKVCQYDFDLSEIDNVNIGYMQDYDRTYFTTNYDKYNGKNFKICSCATGDRFTKQKYFLDIIKDLSAQIVDMECGAIAQVCSSNSIPFISLKLISDVDGKDDSIFEQYQSNVQSICSKIPNAIKELLTNLK